LISRPSRPRIFALLALIALLVGITLLAPEEATLGSKIRWVYLHVAFTWAGTSLINAVGLGGLYLIARPLAMRQSLWVAPGQTAGLILFGIGFGLSLVASYTSWGGILWMEPRVMSSIAMLACGAAVVVLVHLLISPRKIGFVALAASIGWSMALSSTGRVFHPDSPIGASDSIVIKMTFYALTVVAIAFGVVLTMIVKGSPKTQAE
jgi:hypothetical protein